MKILITTQMMIHDQERFGKRLSDFGYDVDFVMNEQYLTEKQCLNIKAEYDGWIAGDDQITKRVIDHFRPSLKAVSKWGTGIDSIDLDYANEVGLIVTNSPGAFEDAVGELAVAYLLVLTRGIMETHNSVLAGGWPKRRYHDLADLTVGIIGMGAIGRGVAKRIKGLGSDVIYTDPKVLTEEYRRVEFNELMTNSNAIIVTCNLSNSTYHLINSTTLSLCHYTPYLINVSRGPIVDEEALAKALEQGVLSGAALDVFEVEPLQEESSLRSLDNIVFGSHNANNTYNAVEYVHENTIINLNKALGKLF
jgi:D-3-phosphoglycerate dehydrogenase